MVTKIALLGLILWFCGSAIVLGWYLLSDQFHPADVILDVVRF